MRALLLMLCVGFAAATTTGEVVQFVVYAEEMSTITQMFPGAKVEFTWNNVFIVTIWTHDAAALIPTVRAALDASQVQVIVPPFPLQAATRKWIEYNMVWVCVLLLVFLCGCTCGAGAVYHSIKRQAPRHRCRTLC